MAAAVTIGRERDPFAAPPRIRRGFAYLGLALIVATIPLGFTGLAAVVAGAGAFLLAWALMPSNYPWLGLFVSPLLAGLALVVGRWLFDE